MAEIPNVDVDVEFRVKALPPESQVRVLALIEARGILDKDDNVTTCTASVGKIQAQDKHVKPNSAPEVMDIYHIATYIVTGEDPWREVR